MNKYIIIVICCFCCLWGCSIQPHDKTNVALTEVKATDSITPGIETELVYDTICMYSPIHIPPFYVYETCPNVDAQCCDMYAETCCFVEIPTEAFYDSIQSECLNGTVILEEHDLGYYFDKWTEKGWVKSNDTTRFVYVEPVENNEAAKFYCFKRDEKTFFCHTHYSRKKQEMKILHEENT